MLHNFIPSWPPSLLFNLRANASCATSLTALHGTNATVASGTTCACRAFTNKPALATTVAHYAEFLLETPKTLPQRNRKRRTRTCTQSCNQMNGQCLPRRKTGARADAFCHLPFIEQTVRSETFVVLFRLQTFGARFFLAGALCTYRSTSFKPWRRLCVSTDTIRHYHPRRCKCLTKYRFFAP